MSEFVNYQKRGIELPPGCKDLIDVLRLHGAASQQPAVTRGCRALGRLSDVPDYVAMVLSPPSEQFALMIGTTDERLSVVLNGRENEGVSALILIGGDAQREKAIREFFQRHGIETLKDYLLPGDAGSGSARALMYPLPAAASQVSQITTDLLGGVYGLTEAAQILFRYYYVA